MAVDGAVADDPLVGVDAVHQLAAGKNPPRAGGEDLQQFEFDGGQVEGDTAQRGEVAGFIEGQPLVLDGGRAAATQHRFDPGHHLAGAVGFADVVVGAEFEAEQAVDLFDPGRDHDDRHAGEFADLFADVHAVFPRQHQVEQHQIGLLLAHFRYRAEAVGDEQGLEAALAQVVSQQFGQFQFVFDDQDLSTHGVLLVIGSRTVIHSPPRGEGRAMIVPSWASTMLRQIERPSPAPPVWRLREFSTR